MTSLPAISLWQPYASLIAVGAKVWETRHYPPPRRVIGQRFAIHASARKPTLAHVAEMRSVADNLDGPGWERRVPYGAIIATAVLEGGYQVVDNRHGSVELEDYGAIPLDSFGNYAVGRWCWDLGDVQPVVPAVPAKGRQGWFKWTPEAPL